MTLEKTLETNATETNQKNEEHAILLHDTIKETTKKVTAHERKLLQNEYKNIAKAISDQSTILLEHKYSNSRKNEEDKEKSNDQTNIVYQEIKRLKEKHQIDKATMLQEQSEEYAIMVNAQELKHQGEIHNLKEMNEMKENIIVEKQNVYENDKMDLEKKHRLEIAAVFEKQHQNLSFAKIEFG